MRGERLVNVERYAKCPGCSRLRRVQPLDPDSPVGYVMVLHRRYSTGCEDGSRPVPGAARMVGCDGSGQPHVPGTMVIDHVDE